MEWLEFLECSNSEELTIDLFGAAPQDDHEVAAQADQWTPEEKQFFENAFSRYNNIGSQTFFEYVASELLHKSMEEIKNYYITLFKDVEMENPPKTKDVVVVAATADHDQQHYQVPQEDDSSKKEATLNGTPPQVEKSRPRRQRGIRWTVEEHRLFLLGLNMFGKGDWNQISKYCVVSKTPTQVASHAQKFFSRQNSTTPVERRRPSINDIRTLYFNPRTTTTTHQLNNGRLAYNNNHQGSSSMLSHYPNYTFGGPIFSNNSNGNFGGSNQGEASGGV